MSLYTNFQNLEIEIMQAIKVIACSDAPRLWKVTRLVEAYNTASRALELADKKIWDARDMVSTVLKTGQIETN